MDLTIGNEISKIAGMKSSRQGEDVMNVRELHAKGLSKSAIAEKLGIDRKRGARLLQEGATRR